MRRVLVIGSSGAGKSTFSRRLSQKTGLPLVHLDKLYWFPNWVETPKDEWTRKVEKAMACDSWIIDGNYSGTLETRLEKCDTVFFLDMPRVVCVYRILKRVAQYRRVTRPDMGEGCDERFDWQFVKLVWDYPNRSKPKVERLLKQFQDSKTIVRLRSSVDVKRFLHDL